MAFILHKRRERSADLTEIQDFKQDATSPHAFTAYRLCLFHPTQETYFTTKPPFSPMLLFENGGGLSAQFIFPSISFRQGAVFLVLDFQPPFNPPRYLHGLAEALIRVNNYTKKSKHKLETSPMDDPTTTRLTKGTNRADPGK